MCGFYKARSTRAWLQGQITVLNAWVRDLSIDPSANAELLACVSEHRAWLIKEINLLKHSSAERAA